MRVLPTLMLLMTMSVFAMPARAWSTPVHELICEMAWLQLTPQAKQLLRRIRDGEAEATRTFAQSCGWADSVRDSEHRDSYEYHFANLPAAANGFDPARDCAAFDCIPVAIHRYLRYVQEPAFQGRLRDRRSRALRFLAHFVADIHQPLHVGFGADRGGNDIVARFGDRESNLHQLFDGELPRALGLTRRENADRLVKTIDARRATSWRTGDVAAWANESFVAAKDRVYPLGRDGLVSDAELRAVAPLLTEQVQKASVRLAYLLNESAAGRRGVEALW